MRQKATYFLGFGMFTCENTDVVLTIELNPSGLVPSLLCGFGPLLLNMAIFALIYPLVRFVLRSRMFAE